MIDYKMKRRYLSVIILLVVLLGVGSYILVRSSGNPARAAPRPRPLSDAPWSVNERVNDDVGTAWQDWPSIAVDSHGNAYAVWEDTRKAYSYIYFSYRPAGGTWEPNVQLSDHHGGEPSIALDPQGNAYAVWRDGSGPLKFSYRPAAGNWGPSSTVTDDAADPGLPDIAVDSHGNAYVVWEDYRNDAGDIYFAYRPADGNWGEDTLVSDDPGTAEQEGPAIAVDSFGNAYIVWQDQRNGNGDIYSSYRPFGGSWEPGVKVNDDLGTAHQATPDIAVDPVGNAYAVWSDFRNSTPSDAKTDIYFSFQPLGDTWQSNVKVGDGGSHALYGQWPEIAVDSDGNAYALWADARSCNPDIYFCHRLAAGSWGNNVRINDDLGAAWQFHPSVGVDSAGNAYAVWVDDRNGNWDIYFSYWPKVEYWAVIVGVADYPGTDDDLDYTDDDARDVYNELVRHPNWSDSNIELLIDSAATTSAIQSAIESVGGQADSNDIFVFFFSGHGTNGPDVVPFDESDGVDEYIVAWDGPIRDDTLADWLSALPTSDIVGVFDSCFSGGLILGLAPTERRGIKTLPSSYFTTRGDGFVEDLVRYERRARDPGDIGGSVMLSASREDELSWEDPILQNSIFSHYFVDGLGGPADANLDSDLSAEELFDYARPRVESFTSGEQHPQMTDNHPGELIVANLFVPPNRLANASFEKDGRIPAPWKGKNLTLKDRGVCKTAHDGSCSFKMVGTTAKKSLRQVVRISGSAGDTFTLRGWSKARNPLRKGGPYCLQARVFHTDGTKKNYRACFAKRTHAWQRRKTTFTTAKPYKKIVVYLLYYKQGGKAWFDDVRLVAQ